MSSNDGSTSPQDLEDLATFITETLGRQSNARLTMTLAMIKIGRDLLDFRRTLGEDLLWELLEKRRDEFLKHLGVASVRLIRAMKMIESPAINRTPVSRMPVK